MDDIIEIYEPIYRQTFNFTPILIIGLSFLTILIVVYIILKIRRKKSIITPEQRYNNVLSDFIKLQTDIGILSSRDFSNKTIFIFKEYISYFFIKDYKSTTTNEMIQNLKIDSNKQIEGLESLFNNQLEPAQYGKLEIDNILKNQIIKECVDFITEIYKEKGVDNV